MAGQDMYEELGFDEAEGEAEGFEDFEEEAEGFEEEAEGFEEEAEGFEEEAEGFEEEAFEEEDGFLRSLGGVVGGLLQAESEEEFEGEGEGFEEFDNWTGIFKTAGVPTHSKYGFRICIQTCRMVLPLSGSSMRRTR